MVYRLTISYRGTAYAGWQRQVNAVAVQQVVEEAFGRLLGESVRVIGASRTDAGVHARGQAAHLELAREFPLRGLVHGANRHLPEDVRIMAAERVPDSFHARKSARAKEYRYRLIRGGVVSPLDAPFAVGHAGALDLAALDEAAGQLAGEHDFSAFALSGGGHGRPVRRMESAEWRRDGERLDFHIVGDGFLRGMVRSLVGTLLEVGAGRRTVDGFGELLAGGPRSAAGPTAPARGLTLERVDYPSSAGWRPEAGAPAGSRGGATGDPAPGGPGDDPAMC